MIRPTDVEPRSGHRIWLRFSDGAAGEIDLSELAGRGVFNSWNSRDFFEAVQITKNGGIAWGKHVELCPDALYFKLTGKSVEDVMPDVKALLEDVDDRKVF